MKVIHVCAGWGDTNGAAVIARQIAHAQKERGVEVEFATWASPVRLRAADEVWTHCGWLPCLWWAGLFARRLVRMPEACYDPVRLAYHGWKKFLVRPLERLFLRMASSVVATCEVERSWIEAYEPRAKVEVVDLREYDWGSGANGQISRPAFGKPRTAPLRVLYMGRRHPLKGLQYLEKAVSEANSESAGDSKHWNLGLTCFPMFELRIVTAAHGAEKEAAFDWCDVFCLPTMSENFGIVVAEALARGKTVVTTDGAPAWADEPRENPDGTKRLVYIEGYRDAAPEERVQMLKAALRQLIML